MELQKALDHPNICKVFDVYQDSKLCPLHRFLRPRNYFSKTAGKHRKHPGGRGNAGGQHHHRINFDKSPRLEGRKSWKS